MDFHLKQGNLARWAAGRWDAAVLLFGADLAAAPEPVRAHLERLLADGDVEAKAGRAFMVARPGMVASARLVLAGVGAGSPSEVRRAAVAAVAAIKGNPAVKSVGIAFCDPADPASLRAAVLGLAEGSYVYTTTKSKSKPAKSGGKAAADGRHLQTVEFVAEQAQALQPELEHVAACIAGVELAKEWGNRPANHATPTHLAAVASQIAKGAGSKLTCEVLGPKEIAKAGMGSFLAVSQASRQEPRFIVLRYRGTAASVAPQVLVGKGITFDTGGISLKPAAEMDEMKFDMCGAASVLGVFQALARWRPKLNVVGLIPSCENMPGGGALKPGDVVTSMSGQTIEVLNTDAEGRLILCDALTYAERFKPAAVVDVATLTGACVIALGHVRTGMYATTDALATRLSQAGEEALDPCWRMPLDDEYAEGLKTNFADVANVAGRAGGSITAAKFLQRFAAKFDWAHLDIAGTAWKSGAAKGATGRPVGLLLAYLAGSVR